METCTIPVFVIISLLWRTKYHAILHDPKSKVHIDKTIPTIINKTRVFCFEELNKDIIVLDCCNILIEIVMFNKHNRNLHLFLDAIVYRLVLSRKDKKFTLHI